MRAFALKLSRPEANTDGLVAPRVEPMTRTPPAKTATHRPATHTFRRSRVEASLNRIGEPAPPGLPAGTGCAGDENSVMTELLSRRAG
jgi:hypothetical protein